MSRTFDGTDITVTETPAGRLVSVLVEIFPDVRTKTLNLLVPVINLPDDATEFPVETVAVLASKSVASRWSADLSWPRRRRMRQ